jgi:signal transduction histidine kinase
VLGGASYPLWWLLGPQDELDPWWPWWAIGALYAVVGGFALRQSREPTLSWFVPSFVTAAHLNLLFALHPSEPFYALAPLLNAFSSLLIFQDRRVAFLFTGWVLLLSLLPLGFSGGTNVLFYVVGSASLLYLAHQTMLSRWRVAPEAADAELRDALDEVNGHYQRERSDRLRLQQELEFAQRMGSVGRMAGSFAHEFNNHLMAIHIHSELLEQGLPPDSPLRRELRNVSAATSEAASLAARLLAYSSESPLREHKTDVTQVLRATRVVIEHVMPSHTEVVFQLPDEACPVAVSPERIEQVLLNLALNARDSMPEGGSLRIELSRRRGSALEFGDALPGTEFVQLAFTDSGAGFAPGQRAFELFDSNEEPATQSELGLSVVYAIVTDSGGLVRLRSGEGRGARFEIFWPVVEREARALRRWLPLAAGRRMEALRLR